MATALPPPRNTLLWVDNATRRRQLEDDNRRLQLEDYRTVSDERGPVRGYPGGIRRGRR